MKALLKRKGNSYPKLARNPAAETGASREPRGGYTQNYTPHPHLPTHSSLTREETMRATHHVPVKRQALAQIQDPRRVLQQATRRGSSRMRGVGAVQVNRANRVSLEVSRDSERTACQTPSRPKLCPANSGTSAPPPHPAGPHEPARSNETPRGNTSSGNHRPASPG